MTPREYAERAADLAKLIASRDAFISQRREKAKERRAVAGLLYPKAWSDFAEAEKRRETEEARKDAKEAKEQIEGLRDSISALAGDLADRGGAGTPFEPRLARLVSRLVALVNEQTALIESRWADDLKRRGTGTARTRPKVGESKKRRALDERISALAGRILDRMADPAEKARRRESLRRARRVHGTGPRKRKKTSRKRRANRSNPKG